MRKKKNSSGDGISANNWMTTFSDLVTLLLTFFVLLFSMSSMDEQKLKIAFQNFSGGSGLLSYKEYSEISRPMEVLIEGLHQTFEEKVVADNVTESDFGDDIAGNLKHFGNLMDLEPLSDGLKISFGASVLFESGKAEISQEFLVILSHIAKFLSVSGYQAYIEGHTDNIPISDNALYNQMRISLLQGHFQ
jgi:chemotaxis protein MotB